MGRLQQITQLKKYTVGEIFYFFLVFPLVHQVGFTILAYLFLNTETTIVFNHFAGPRKMCTLEQTSLLLDLTYQFFPKIFTDKAFPPGIYSFLSILLALSYTDSTSMPRLCLLSWRRTVLYSFNLHTS